MRSALLLAASLWAAAPEGAADARLAAFGELLGFLEKVESGGPIGPTDRDRAWSLVWEHERSLSPRTLELLRLLLLKADLEGGPLAGLPALADSSARERSREDAERASLLREAGRLELSSETAPLVALIVRHAPLEDARLAVGTLRRERPAVELRAGDMRLGSVGLFRERERRRPLIRLRREVALVRSSRPQDGVFQLALPSGPYYPVPASESYYLSLGLEPPPLEALQPRALPVSEEGGLSLYADGSGLYRFSQGHLAGVLLHELHHLDTLHRGGGEDPGVMELRSFLAQFRLYDALADRLGSPTFLDVNRESYERWRRNPAGLRLFLEAAYQEDRGMGGEGGPAARLAAARSALGLDEAGFLKAAEEARGRALRDAAASRREEARYLSYVGLYPDGVETAPAEPGPEEQEDFRQSLEKAVRRLPVDAELELEARLEDWRWRRLKDEAGRAGR